MRQGQMKQSAQDLNTISDKLECQNLPKIYQEITWHLFQMKCKYKHVEELQGSYKQPSCGGPDKESQREENVQRKKETKFKKKF